MLVYKMMKAITFFLSGIHFAIAAHNTPVITQI